MKTKILFINLLIVLGLITVSCVEDKIYTGPSNISKIEISPKKVTPDDAVTVSATITDLQGVTSADIEYQVNGGAKTKVKMTGSADVYSGVIPKQADKSEVKFTIIANNKANILATSAEQSYTVGADPIDYKVLVLNELNGNDKFIEIFNKGAVAVPLNGVYIEKDGLKVWTGSDTQKLAANSYLLLFSVDVQANKPEHPIDQFFGSGLSAKKAVRVQLFDPTASSIDDFNLVGYEKAAPASYSRWENGTGKWVFAAATPGAVNVKGDEAVPGLQ